LDLFIDKQDPACYLSLALINGLLAPEANTHGLQISALGVLLDKRRFGRIKGQIGGLT